MTDIINPHTGDTIAVYYHGAHAVLDRLGRKLRAVSPDNAASLCVLQWSYSGAVAA